MNKRTKGALRWNEVGSSRDVLTKIVFNQPMKVPGEKKDWQMRAERVVGRN